ncbi:MULTISPECIES: hypothetical protein [Lactobacillus]|uniref:DUF2892 domain-containing protein n=1 Tax=Lactobacillus xujianguonis TaxID=2495899 RepID=A0A437STM1_9LACO|nr:MULTISPECIES: hypothetical protein [Lactobacillus]RVU70258.1 hypothetical protein EJK17_08695 [Lactobacillus xujianguonis]RVU72093.1 hypothetical protein EJK20_10875 [Lactobacillus xujianguonis]
MLSVWRKAIPRIIWLFVILAICFYNSHNLWVRLFGVAVVIIDIPLIYFEEKKKLAKKDETDSK